VDRELAADLAKALTIAAEAFDRYAQRKQDAARVAEDESFARTRAYVATKVFANTPNIAKIIDGNGQLGGPRQP
jgi:hypothetical protein